VAVVVEQVALVALLKAFPEVLAILKRFDCLPGRQK
jgi:hypothetical protein